MDAFALLLPFLRKLQAMRLLVPPAEKLTREQSTVQSDPNSPVPSFSNIYEMFDLDDELHAEKISAVTADRERARSLRIVGLGWKVWELGDYYYIPAYGNAPPGPEADSYQSPTSNHSNSEAGRGNQPNPAHTSSNIPYMMKTPKSSLGKHARDETSPYSGSYVKPSLVMDEDNHYDTLPNGERIIWRRRVRPVGWEVLKKWEIFALDSQDV